MCCRRYLATTAPAGLRWAIAGRSQTKLDAILAGLPGGGTGVATIVADTRDASSVDAMVGSTRVILTTVGPYALYGTAVVEAASAAHCSLAPPWRNGVNTPI